MASDFSDADPFLLPMDCFGSDHYERRVLESQRCGNLQLTASRCYSGVTLRKRVPNNVHYFTEAF
jgi:hypothetical protein